MFILKGSKVQYFLEIILRELNLEIDQLIEGLVIDYLKNIDNGMNKKQALGSVLNEVQQGIGRFNAFENTINRLVKEQVKVAIAKPAIEQGKEDPSILYKWVLGDVATSHCPDCLMLSKQSARTIQEWRAFGKGLPREGLTKCNVGCRCALKPIST